MDYSFYKNLYFDLINLTDKQLHSHYIKYGAWEGRICSKEMMQQKIKKNKLISDNRNSLINNYTSKTPHKKINILIRTSNRPKCFSHNINSIIKQNYNNLKLLISYDNEYTKEYILKELLNKNLDYEIIKVDHHNNKYHYNDYCNHLLNKVDDGYVIFLDDDDKLIHDNALKYINDYLEEDIFLVWDYLRADKIIGPKKGEIKKGNITSCGFCYNSKYKSFWPAEINADFTFVDTLLKNNKLKVGKLNKVLTGSINLNTIYGQGKREDI
jgi:hypothetical protein